MIFDHIQGMMSKDLGIDLGTANTLVCARGEGIILSEPSVVAVKRGTNKVYMVNGELAVGEKAKQMLGRTPGSIEAIRPMKNGVIADFEITEALLSYFIRKAHGRSRFIRPRVIVAVPSGITTVEKRAVINSAERAGARDVRLIKEPMAAAIGVGLPVTEPKGSMIVDIGGGTAEVAVISLADIVRSSSLRVAGDELNDAIIKHMKEVYNLQIGETTAERVKIEIGSAYPMEEELVKEVKGMDTLANLPRTVNVRSEEIREALHEPLDQIVRSIKSTLEGTPPELAADLIESGITLAGGGALLRGLDKMLARETGLPVRRADDPLTAVARGTGVVLDQIDSLWQVLEDGREVG
ncbi:MAG TPA: rod shape-determining protein [Planctomycetota bacterium]|nr:rod shape-determining protein [Planctomycetota bacterium]